MWGGFGSPILAGVLPGAGVRWLWQPPGYVAGLAAWFRIFGFGLLQGRAFSALGLSIATVAVFLIAQRWLAKPVSIFVAGFFLLTPQVLDNGLVIRPDAWTAAAVGWAMVAYLSWLATDKRSAFLLSALASAAAILVHPMGAIAAISVLAHGAVSKRNSWRAYVEYAAVASVAVVVLWGSFVVGYWSDFARQLGAQAVRKNSTFDVLFLIHGPRENLIIEMTITASAVLLLRAWRELKTAEELAIVWLVVAVVGVTSGHEMQYPLLAFMPGAAAIAAAVAHSTHRVKQIALAILVGVISVGSVHAAVTFLTEKLVSQTVAAYASLVPPGAHVMLGPGAAAMYFGIDDRERLRVYVPVPIPPGTHARVAKQQGLLAMNAPAVSRPPQDASAIELDDLARSCEVITPPDPVGIWRVSRCGTVKRMV